MNPYFHPQYGWVYYNPGQSSHQHPPMSIGKVTSLCAHDKATGKNIIISAAPLTGCATPFDDMELVSWDGNVPLFEIKWHVECKRCMRRYRGGHHDIWKCKRMFTDDQAITMQVRRFE